MTEHTIDLTLEQAQELAAALEKGETYALRVAMEPGLPSESHVEDFTQFLFVRPDGKGTLLRKTPFSPSDRLLCREPYVIHPCSGRVSPVRTSGIMVSSDKWIWQGMPSEAVRLRPVVRDQRPEQVNGVWWWRVEVRNG